VLPEKGEEKKHARFSTRRCKCLESITSRRFIVANGFACAILTSLALSMSSDLEVIKYEFSFRSIFLRFYSLWQDSDTCNSLTGKCLKAGVVFFAKVGLVE